MPQARLGFVELQPPPDDPSGVTCVTTWMSGPNHTTPSSTSWNASSNTVGSLTTGATMSNVNVPVSPARTTASTAVARLGDTQSPSTKNCDSRSCGIAVPRRVRSRSHAELPVLVMCTVTVARSPETIDSGASTTTSPTANEPGPPTFTSSM